ncbi:MAG: NAD-dependent epimerase/dehydratase family protein, partial [Rhizobiales bacterium]|nr:NAD-dependent epimerase/dehydratase family protein [Hyphomicrobiales bacterium]
MPRRCRSNSPAARASSAPVRWARWPASKASSHCPSSPPCAVSPPRLFPCRARLGYPRGGRRASDRGERDGRLVKTTRDGRDTILVTGGAGFIGSNIARALAADGWRIVVSDWFGTGGKWKNLAGVLLDDVLRPEDATEWLAANQGRVEAVVHMGAI